MVQGRKSVFNVLFDGEGISVDPTDTQALARAARNAHGLTAFNTLSGALAVLDARGADALAKADGAVYPELVKAGFILADDAPDEREQLTRHYLRDMNETGFLALCIAPTLACNLRCVYCYEQHEALRMSAEVEDGIMRFVTRRHEAYGFSDLDVLWYGGEPVLELDLIERLSQRLIAWCAQVGVRYHARMTSNTALVDDAAARRLAEAGVTEVMPTLDGCAGCHDMRRVTVGGGGSYDDTRAGIAAFRRAGVSVGVNCNLDRDNVADFRRLRAEFADDPNLDIYASHLRDYGGWSANIPNLASAGAPDLLSRQEYADQLFELYAELRPNATSVAASLSARRSFCLGMSASYFVVDPEGNVCHCDGRMRDEAYVLFNVLDDDYDLDWPQRTSFMERDPRCAACALAPLCLGDCDWEHSLFDDNCIALKYTLGRYVMLLRERLEEGAITRGGNAADAQSGVVLLAAPRDVDAFYAAPFSPWS